MISDKKRIIFYIDGSNFYFSCKKKFGSNLDIGKFCNKLLGEDNLLKINYYIAPVGESNLKMYSEQQRFFEKLRKIKNLKIVFGRLEKRKRDGETYYVEKATDVNMALDLVLDAQANEFDEAYLISNDGDFSGAVEASVKRFNKEIIYVAIGTNKTISHHLRKVASGTLKISEEFIKDIKI